MKVSVCIVNFNTREMLRGCLRSVFIETEEIALDVIVVDNASTDGSAEMVAAEFPQARLIRNAENRRFAGGANQALRAATGEYLLMLNSDTVVRDRAIERMAAFMAEHRDVGALGCRLVSADGTPTMSYGCFPSLRRNLAYWWPWMRGRWDAHAIDGIPPAGALPMEVEYPSGACLLTTREVLEKTGLLDEGFFLYGEETDFCLRARRAGYRSVLAPVDVVHVGGGSNRAPGWQTMGRARLAEWRFVRKHRSFAYFAAFVAVECVGMAWWTARGFPRALLKGSADPPPQDRVRVVNFILRGGDPGRKRG